MEDLKVGDEVWYWPSSFDERRPGIGQIVQGERPIRATVLEVIGDSNRAANLQVHLEGREFKMTYAVTVQEHFPGGGDAHRAAGTCFDRERATP